MAKFTEEEVQQLLMAILDAAVGYKHATGKRKRNPTAIQLPNGRKVDIDAAVPICDGIGLSVRDHADPENAAEISLRIEFGTTPADIVMAGVKCGIVPGTVEMPLGRILKQSESLPAAD